MFILQLAAFARQDLLHVLLNVDTVFHFKNFFFLSLFVAI